MPKLAVVEVDKKQPFILMDAKTFHIVARDTRKNTIKSWYQEAISTGVVTSGRSMKVAQLVRSGSTSLMRELKNILNKDYFDKFNTQLENFLGDDTTTQNQSTCFWDTIVRALSDAIGQNSEVRLTLDYFSKNDLGVAGRFLSEAFLQAKRGYVEAHGTKANTLMKTRFNNQQNAYIEAECTIKFLKTSL